MPEVIWRRNMLISSFGGYFTVYMAISWEEAAAVGHTVLANGVYPYFILYTATHSAPSGDVRPPNTT